MSSRDLVVNNLGMVALAILWGTMIPSLVVLLEIWDAYFVAAIRYALAIPLFLLLILAVERGRLVPPGIGIWRLMVLGLVGYGVFSPMFTLGVSHTHPVTAVILSSAAPVVGAAVARICFGVPIDRRMAPAVILAVLGAALATYDPEKAGLPFAVTGGEFLLIGAMACWNWYSMAAQRWLAGMSQLRITGLTVIPGAAILVLVYLAAAAIGLAELPPQAPRGAGDLLIVAWVVCGCIVGGILLWNWGVKQFGIVIPNLYMNLVPMVAIGLSAMIGYVPTPVQLAGGALVVIGILASQLARLRGSKSQPTTG
jgi:drug/metabolite transporter (DMT)-like permease